MSKVYLEDIAQAFEDMADGWKGYVDRIEGEVIFVPLSQDAKSEFSKEELLEFETEEFFENLVSLPEQKALREYDIMEQYTEDIMNTGYKQRLSHALHNNKPFRNFRAQIRYLGLEDDYFHYRFVVFTSIARKFCLENKLEFEIESDEIREYIAQVEDDEKFDQEMESFSDTLDEFDYEEEYDDYFD
ncbi:MAG: UPF0158 family protein [Bacillota bacterium]|nr:UPF0158 family protein [Bacillota bacterium]